MTGKNFVFGESIFSNTAPYTEIVKTKILNSYFYAKAFAYCVNKFSQKESAFTVSDAHEKGRLFEMNRITLWKYFKELNKAGFLMTRKQRGKNANEINTLVFYPVEAIISDLEFCKAVNELLSGGNGLK